MSDERERRPLPSPEHLIGALPLDPWQHRSVHMRCRTCMFYTPKDEGNLGRCRRHAPTMGGFPVVYPSDWCGDHKLQSV